MLVGGAAGAELGDGAAVLGLGGELRTRYPGQDTSGPAHDGQSGRGNPRSRPAAAYAPTASGHGHTMATGDTAPDPFSRPAQHGRSRPRGCAASGCGDRHHAGLLPRADGTLRSSPGSQGSAVQEQEEISKCRRR